MDDADTGHPLLPRDVTPRDSGDAPPFGFPVYRPVHACDPVAGGPSVDTIRPSPAINFDRRRHGAALASVCTLNYLHLARAMIGSVRAHHAPDTLAVYLLIVDWDGIEPFDRPLDIPGVTVLPGCAIGIDRFEYLALKYTAAELCCASKPHLLRHLMATTACHKILYLDTDLYVFSPLDHLLACLDDAPLVVVPHTLAPPPSRDRPHVRPALSQIIYAGTYNAGMFGLTVDRATATLAGEWADLVSSPGAFLNDVDNQQGEQEQQIFNWLVSLADGVHVLKDTSYNVAYWNLHDRSLRYTGWDEPGLAPGWRVDGRPLVAFHFSGFSFTEPHRLSHHDSRYELYFLPSVAKLIEFYLERLLEHGALTAFTRPYRYDRFPSGLPITAPMRLIFKTYETYLARDFSPWDDAGERYYAQSLLLPVPHTSSLLPVALYQIYERRPDLQAAFPQAHLDPDPMLGWFSYSGMTEEPQLYAHFDAYRPVVPTPEGVQEILDLQRDYPAPFAGLPQPMSRDRTTLLTSLVQTDSTAAAAAYRLQSLALECIALSPIYLLRRVVKQQPHLQQAFPDLLFADAPAFADWLREHASRHFLEEDLAGRFMQKAQGRSLARIFSFLNSSPEMGSQWPLALVGQHRDACARALLVQLQFDRQFDLDDIVMYLWVMDTQPWAGLPLTFELLVNACRRPSPLLPEGQDALLGPLLAEPGFGKALAAYRNQMGPRTLDEMHARSHQRPSGVMNGWPHVRPAHARNTGVNLFGFFKSPVGLGSLSHGLALALRSAAVQVQENVLSNASMEPDLRPEDFIRTYDHSLHTNLFVTYPHLMHRLLDTYPEHVVRGRRHIAYLAWEQRDGFPSWEHDYADFHHIWALSRFAAESFRRYMNRDDVVAIPGVVDFESFPSPATKDAVGLDPDRFTFLYVFDASSSVERKNPEGAIRAFARAFSPREGVQLLLKVTNAHRLDCRDRLRQVTSLAARSGMDIRFLMANLPRPSVLRTMSAVDCYVSLHRAEGFGYTCAEAMAYARPVIATNYSGTTEFMDDASAFLVDYTECEVTVADGPFQRGSVWAEPSIEHAAAQMRRVYRDRAAARRIADAGQVKVRELLSADRVGRIAAAALAGKATDGARSR